MPAHLSSPRRFRGWLVAAICLLSITLPLDADAQSAVARYNQAMAREKAARAAASPTVASLRAIAASYEAIARRYPKSGYSDNALWQGAGMYQLAFERAGNARDREQATRLLTWLKKGYPTASLAKQVDSRLASLAPPARNAAAATTTAPAPAAPPRPTAPDAAPPVSQVKAAVPAATRATQSTKAEPAATAPAVAPSRATKAAPASVPAATMSTPVAPIPVPEPPVVSTKDGSPAVRSLTYSTLPKGDRLTIELNGEVPYSTTRATGPDRVMLDLTGVGVSTAVLDRATQISGSLLKSLRVTSTAGNSTRLVLELTGSPRYSTFPLYNPFRLVVDVESDTATSSGASLGGATAFVAKPALSVTTPTAPPPLPPLADVMLKPADVMPTHADAAASIEPAVERPVIDRPAERAPVVSSAPPTPIAAPRSPSITSHGDYSLARQLGLGVSRVVIDPGHGGHDPGAQANGVTEAELVLDVAQRLGVLLHSQAGFDVVLTRDTNEFIALEERTAIANREAADMFISIHANSSPRATTRGIETYFLDFAPTPQAEALAARENASSSQSMRLLPELVKTIALTNKLDESRELARTVQSSLVKRLGVQSTGLKDLGVKRAPFVVLIGAQMPSVLAEISFLTNRSDASLLKQSQYRQKIAQALADAVIKYRTALKNGPVAQKAAAR